MVEDRATSGAPTGTKVSSSTARFRNTFTHTGFCFSPTVDGKICLPQDGGVLDEQVPRPRPKHPGHADGLFGVCAPFESGGRRQKGKRMRPLRYRGFVVGMKAYAVELLKEQERVRQLGLRNRANVADPKKPRARPGVWYKHCDPGVNPYEVS